MDAGLLGRNLDSCLLGTADNWYTNQLAEPFRVGLRNDPEGIKHWCDALEARFRDSPGKSLTLLENIRYEIRDVRNRKDPAEYVSAIVLNAKNAGIAIDEAAQVLLAYEHMDGHLRRDLPRRPSTSTVSGVIEELRHQKDIWFGIYGRHDVHSNKYVKGPALFYHDFRCKWCATTEAKGRGLFVSCVAAPGDFGKTCTNVKFWLKVFRVTCCADLYNASTATRMKQQQYQSHYQGVT